MENGGGNERAYEDKERDRLYEEGTIEKEQERGTKGVAMLQAL